MRRSTSPRFSGSARSVTACGRTRTRRICWTSRRSCGVRPTEHADGSCLALYGGLDLVQGAAIRDSVRVEAWSGVFACDTVTRLIVWTLLREAPRCRARCAYRVAFLRRSSVVLGSSRAVARTFTQIEDKQQNSMVGQRTLKNSIRATGVGFHTGKKV